MEWKWKGDGGFFTEEEMCSWLRCGGGVGKNWNGDGRRWNLCRKEDEATVVQRSGRSFCRVWERKWSRTGSTA